MGSLIAFCQFVASMTQSPFGAAVLLILLSCALGYLLYQMNMHHIKRLEADGIVLRTDLMDARADIAKCEEGHEACLNRTRGLLRRERAYNTIIRDLRDRMIRNGHMKPGEDNLSWQLLEGLDMDE